MDARLVVLDLVNCVFCRDEVEGVVEIDEGEEEEFKASECSCAICSCMNGIYGRWEKWSPSTPMEEIFQKHINAIAS